MMSQLQSVDTSSTSAKEPSSSRFTESAMEEAFPIEPRLVVFDLRSQPHYRDLQDTSKSDRSARGLFFTRPDTEDRCVLGNYEDHAHIAWLYSVDLGPHPSQVITIPIASAKQMLLADALPLHLNDHGEGATAISSNAVVVPFYTSPADATLATALANNGVFGAPEAVGMLLNDKASNKQLCIDCDLPTVKGFIEQPGQDLAGALERVQRFLEEERSVIIRASQGSGGSGIGIFHADSPTVAADLKRFFEANQKQGTFLVEQFLPVADSLNVQVAVGEDHLTFIGMSSQLLSEGTKHEGNRGGYCYLGNRIPEEYQEAVEASFTLAHAARDVGYRGILGFDFIVSEEGDVFCIETNARVNGSTLAHKVIHDVALRHSDELDDISWSLVTVETAYDSFDDVTRKLATCEFTLLPSGPLERGRYVIPVENLGQGRWSMLLIDSSNPEEIIAGSDKLSFYLKPARPEFVLTTPVRDELVGLYQSAGVVREQRYGFADWSTKPDSIADWATNSADKTIVLKTRTGEVAGAVSLTSEVPATAPSSLVAGALQISRLAVHPDFEGRGLGSLLLREAEEYCRQLGHDKVYLYWRGESSHPTGEDLGAFYANRGYEPTVSTYVPADEKIAVDRFHHYGVKWFTST